MIFLPLFAAISPFFLWPIEFIAPYPHIIEELAKAILVWFIIKIPSTGSRVRLAIASGVLFALSESIFYIININLVGNIQTLVQRLALTISLHVLTILIMLYFFSKDRRLIPVGLILAMLAHLSYNLAIGYLTLKAF